MSRRLPKPTALAWPVLLTALVTLVAPASTAGPARIDPAIERGADLAQEKCSGCHAVALEATSPERNAPLFRILSRLYAAPDLQRKLDDISDHGHFEMPPVHLREDQVRELAAYIASLDGGAGPTSLTPRQEPWRALTPGR